MSKAGEYIEKAAECGLGICLSIVSHGVGRLGFKALSNYYSIHPATVSLAAKDIHTDSDHAIGTITGFITGQVASVIIGTFSAGISGTIVAAAGFAIGEAVCYFVNKYTDSKKLCAGISSQRSPTHTHMGLVLLRVSRFAALTPK